MYGSKNLRNIATKLPCRIQKDCLAELARIFQANSPEEAEKRFLRQGKKFGRK